MGSCTGTTYPNGPKLTQISYTLDQRRAFDTTTCCLHVLLTASTCFLCDFLTRYCEAELVCSGSLDYVTGLHGIVGNAMHVMASVSMANNFLHDAEFACRLSLAIVAADSDDYKSTMRSQLLCEILMKQSRSEHKNFKQET